MPVAAFSAAGARTHTQAGTRRPRWSTQLASRLTLIRRPLPPVAAADDAAPACGPALLHRPAPPLPRSLRPRGVSGPSARQHSAFCPAVDPAAMQGVARPTGRSRCATLVMPARMSGHRPGRDDNEAVSRQPVIQFSRIPPVTFQGTAVSGFLPPVFCIPPVASHVTAISGFPRPSHHRPRHMSAAWSGRLRAPSPAAG